MKKWLTFVDIRAGEGALVGLVLLYALCATTTDILINTTAYALFLHAFDAQELPYIYVGMSLGTVLIATIYLQLSQRYTLAQMLGAMHLLLLLTLIGYRVSLSVTTARWLLFSLPIWHGISNVLLYIALWNLVGRLFNLQQGKRLFGLFGAAQQVASLGVGLLIPLLVVGLGVPNLLWAATGAGTGALLLLVVIARTYPRLHEMETGETEPTEAAAPPTNPLWGDAYIRLMFALFVLFALGSYFIDNIFYNRLESHYPSEAQLAGFLGIFNGMVGGLSLFSQLFVANRLLQRYGVRAAVILTPLLLLIGTLLFVLTGQSSSLVVLHFWLAVGMNLTQQVMNDTDNTAANLLYQPLPTTLRTRTQTVVDGIVSPTAVGLAGFLLLLLTNGLHFDALHLAYVLLPILLAWAVAGRLLGRAYGQRVQQALRQRLIQGKQNFVPDRASLEIIQQTLADPRPGAVIYALDILEAHDRRELARALPALLVHPSATVRLEALARLERLGENGALAVIVRCWQQDRDPTVRHAALQAVAALGGLSYDAMLYNQLATADRAARRSVMIGLLRSGELEAILAVGEALARLVNSPNPQDRVLVAQVLGESGVASFYRPLLALLDDPEPSVQRAALVAAGKLRHPKLWPALMTALAAPQTRGAARAALVASGEALLPTLQTLLSDNVSAAAQLPPLLTPSPLTPSPLTSELRSELIHICGRLRHPQAVALLLAHLDDADLAVRTLALQALYQCSYQATDARRALLEQQLQREFAGAAWLVAGLVDLTMAPPVTLVYTALVESLRQQRKRLFWLLTLLYGSAKIQQVRDAFGLATGSRRQRSEEQRSYLLETIDLLLPTSITRYLTPLLDELTPLQQQSRLSAAFPQPMLSPQQRLVAISASSEPWVSRWLRAVALYSAITTFTMEEAGADLVTAARTAYASPDPLLHEIGGWALTRLATARLIPDHPAHDGEQTMLLTIEKVIILRTVDIFADTPDEVLVEIAGLLKEMTAPAATTIFAQGEAGDSMYIIVEGEVEALDGERVFTRMGERQPFGEMALLDGEPRTATIRTTQATHLLRLDQEPFYELMEDRIEIARGIIHVLLQRLRARTNDVNRLQAQLYPRAPESNTL